MNEKVSIQGENWRRQRRVNSPFLRARSLIRYCAGSDLRSALLELQQDYLRVKSGFLPRSGCL